jgi:hypothetical protein
MEKVPDKIFYRKKNTYNRKYFFPKKSAAHEMIKKIATVRQTIVYRRYFGTNILFACLVIIVKAQNTIIFNSYWFWYDEALS